MNSVDGVADIIEEARKEKIERLVFAELNKMYNYYFENMMYRIDELPEEYKSIFDEKAWREFYFFIEDLIRREINEDDILRLRFLLDRIVKNRITFFETERPFIEGINNLYDFRI